MVFVESHGFEHEWQVIDDGLTDNGIDDDGAMELAQSLQHNTTLTALYLNGLCPKTRASCFFPIILFMDCVCSGNNITDDGKLVLESKCNKDTLTMFSV